MVSDLLDGAAAGSSDAQCTNGIKEFPISEALSLFNKSPGIVTHIFSITPICLHNPAQLIQPVNLHNSITSTTVFTGKIMIMKITWHTSKWAHTLV